MKTTIIELLNTIARGETPPKKIMYDDEIFEYDKNECKYKFEDSVRDIESIYDLTDILNDEVEILETTITYKPDKIEKIDLEDTIQNDTDLGTTCKIINKINEIIDKLYGE